MIHKSPYLSIYKILESIKYVQEVSQMVRDGCLRINTAFLVVRFIDFWSVRGKLNASLSEREKIRARISNDVWNKKASYFENFTCDVTDTRIPSFCH